jgi:hypothetical protein
LVDKQPVNEQFNAKTLDVASATLPDNKTTTAAGTEE